MQHGPPAADWFVPETPAATALSQLAALTTQYLPPSSAHQQTWHHIHPTHAASTMTGLALITTVCIHTNSSATIRASARHSHAPICILSTSSDHQSTPLTRNNTKFFTTLPPRNGQHNQSLSVLVSHVSFSIVPHLYVGVLHPTTTSHRFHVSTTNITTSNIRNTWVHTNHMT